MVAMTGIRLPRLRLPRQPRFTDENRPETFDDLVGGLETQRVAGWWRGVGVLLLLAAMPMILWLAITIGARARAANCVVVERALHGENAGITETFAKAFIDPGDSPEEVARVNAKAEAVRKDLDHNVSTIMENCDG